VSVAPWPPSSQPFSSPSSKGASSKRTRSSRAGKSSKALSYSAAQNPHSSLKAFPASVTSKPVISPPKCSRPSALPSLTSHPTTSRRAPPHPSLRKVKAQTRASLPFHPYMPSNPPVPRPTSSPCPRSNPLPAPSTPPPSPSSGSGTPSSTSVTPSDPTPPSTSCGAPPRSQTRSLFRCESSRSAARASSLDCGRMDTTLCARWVTRSHCTRRVADSRWNLVLRVRLSWRRSWRCRLVLRGVLLGQQLVLDFAIEHGGRLTGGWWREYTWVGSLRCRVLTSFRAV
jgi:hypothetical protein